jgi:hypothetical protein
MELWPIVATLVVLVGFSLEERRGYRLLAVIVNRIRGRHK